MNVRRRSGAMGKLRPVQNLVKGTVSRIKDTGNHSASIKNAVAMQPKNVGVQAIRGAVSKPK